MSEMTKKNLFLSSLRSSLSQPISAGWKSTQLSILALTARPKNYLSNINQGGFQVSVKNFEEAFKFCQMMSETDLCPDSYKPSTFLNRICGQDQKARLNPENIKKAKEMSVNNIFIACSYGGTLGLNPFQSLQGVV